MEIQVRKMRNGLKAKHNIGSFKTGKWKHRIFFSIHKAAKNLVPLLDPVNLQYFFSLNKETFKSNADKRSHEVQFPSSPVIVL